MKSQSIAVLSILLNSPASKSWPTTGLDHLDPLNTCSRHDVSLLTIGDMVYAYGGEDFIINKTSPGSPPIPTMNRYLRILDFTKPRDINDSTLMTAESIPPDVTLFRAGGYWGDESRLYVTGGHAPGVPYLTEEGQFVPTNWTLAHLSASTVFTYDIESRSWDTQSALQPDNGLTAQNTFCCGFIGWNTKSKKGYIFSGGDNPGYTQLEPGAPNQDIGPAYNQVTGTGNLLTFDTNRFKWKNQTTDNNLTTPWSDYGAFVSLPGTESTTGGIVVLLGGVRRKPTDHMESLRRVLVYDSGADQWYSQETTAESDSFPEERGGFCAIAASAPDNSSHNIYVYGGWAEAEGDSKKTFADMYILSVPAFHWIPVNVSSDQRGDLGCSKVADRYMVTFGGIQYENMNKCDQENRGVKLFDLSKLSWTSHYDGPATSSYAYTVPSPVYNIIGGDGNGAATKIAPNAGFNTEALSAVFKSSTSTSTSSGSAKPQAPSSKSKGTHTAAIAGGVVCGIMVLGAIIGALWFMRWRRERVIAVEKAVEKDDSGPVCELDAKKTYEVYGSLHLPAQELDGGRHPRPELGSG